MGHLKHTFWIPLLLLTGISAYPQTPDHRATFTERWSDLFGGQEARFHLAPGKEGASHIRLNWNLAVNQQVVARRETAVSTETTGTNTIEIALEIPATKDGVVLPAILTATLECEGQTEPTRAEKRLWIFPQDPFTLKHEWLKNLSIRLFDPLGPTAKAFDSLKIPYDSVRSVDAIRSLDQGLLIVGEGVSFRDYRGLWDELQRAAERGLPTLCLAPSAGQIAVPIAGRDSSAPPEALSFRRADVITETDKRLDAQGWPPDNNIVASSVSVTGDRSGVVGEIEPGEKGWPWFEAHYGPARSALILCGFPVIQKWETTPAARYFLASLLERIGKTKEE